MKKSNLLLCLCLIVLSACSSSSKKESNDDIELPDDLSEAVSTIDSKAPKKEVVYDRNNDYFADVKNSSDILTSESLARFDGGRLDVAIDSKDPLSQAIGYCYKKDFDRGLGILKKVYSEFSKNAGYFNMLGTCYYLKIDYIKASTYYNKAIDLDKNYAPAWNNLGVIFLKEKEDHKAKENFVKAMTLAPFSKTPRFNLAQVHLQYGYVEDAFDIFNGLYSSNSNDPDIIIGLANTHLFKGEVGKAVNLFKTLDSTYLKRPDAGLNYAVALRLSGDNNGAKLVYRRVDAGQLSSWTVYYRRVGQFIGGEL